jgi:hypothetical protein
VAHAPSLFPVMYLRSSIVALALLAAACTGSGSNDDPDGVTDLPQSSTSTPLSTNGSTMTSADLPQSSTSTPLSTNGSTMTSADLPGDLPAVTGAWQTDWSRSTIDLDELLIGIFTSDPRDVIRPLDDPIFESVAAGSEWLGDREPGVLLRGDAAIRFYPLSILTRHEIVNDEIDETPIAVTYCPLCNTAAIFDRRLDGTTYRFGVSGLLRNSDLVMWDDATDSLWQQITGEGIVGTHAGSQLSFVPSSIVSFSEFAESFPTGSVLSRETGFGFPYGINPYEFYSSRGRPFGFFTGEPDSRFPALERVVGVSVNDIEKAYPFSVLEPIRAANDVIDGVPVVVLWGGDTADALDSSSIAASRAVGTGVAYSPVVDGTTLSLSPADDGEFVDAETGSSWNLLGVATSGPLQGTSLDVITHRNEFWFAWAAFFPNGDVYGS